MIPTETVVATVQDFAERAQAQRVVVLIDRGDERPAAMLEWLDGGLTWTADDVTAAVEAGRTGPLGQGRGVPLPLGDLRPPPASAVHVHAEAGELHAPIGAIGHLADALLDLAAALGGRSVASAEWPTDDPEVPLVLAARIGEPVVITLGDDAFELPIA